MAQQTAVGLLIKELRQLAHNTNHHLGLGDIRITQGMIDGFEEKYNQMEKEQHYNTWLTAEMEYPDDDSFAIADSFEKYYKKTYGTG